MARTNSARRASVASVAEKEVMRYKGDHYLWHRHVHNIELDAMQILKMHQMDEHLYTVDYSCRRTGKTFVKECYNLEQLATYSDQELGIVAPREAQSIVALNYQLEAIRRSEILTAFIAHKAGRKRISDTSFEFANRSKANSYGIMANVDGGDLTIASLEEVDDMPADRLYGRFLLMLGATRRAGAAKDARNDPAIRITGVFKGADTLDRMIKSGEYHQLPVVHAYLAIEMGLFNADFLRMMRGQLSHDEYIRQLLCKNVTGRNFIWEIWHRKAIQLGTKVQHEVVEPVPGEYYTKRGRTFLGYDHTGHGERPESSHSHAVVFELIDGYVFLLYAKRWAPGIDDNVVKHDLCSIWRYFLIDDGYGDAYGVGMLTDLNELLYKEGLTRIDRRAINGGDSTASSWPHWPFKPIRFEGMMKHQMAAALKGLYSNNRLVMPYVDHIDPSDDTQDAALRDMRITQQQVLNIRADATQKTYSSYKQVDTKVGDDGFDAMIAGAWAIINQGHIVQTIIMSNALSHAQMHGASLALPDTDIPEHDLYDEAP